MARQTCPLSSRHMLCLVSAVFAAFLIQSNESLIPIWGKRCISNQAVSTSISGNDRGEGCLRTSFFRVQKTSSTVVGSGGDDETPTYFFADKDTDESDEKEAEKAAAEEKAAKERAAEEAAEQARLDEIARQAKLEEEIRLADEEREKMFNEWKEKVSGAVGAVEKAIKPFSEIQEGVSEDRIKGAAIAATALTFMVSKGVVASGAVGLSAAYLSISKTVAGDVLRQVGELTWDATEAATKVAGQFGGLPTFGEVDKTVVNKYKRRKPTVDVDEGELAFIEAEDDDLTRVLKEAESVISEADAAIAKAEADQNEKVKQSIEEELKQIIDENEVEGQANEVVDDEEEEEEYLEEDEEEEEEEDLDEEENEEDDDELFDDDQFMAAVELAQEGIEGKIVGVDDIISDNSIKAEWDAAGELANELRQDIDASSEADGDEDDEEDDYFDDLEFEDIDVEALGRAAREAVETFETEQLKVNEALLDKKQEWADSMIEEDDDEDDDVDFEDIEDLFSADSLDAARATVEASLKNAEDKRTGVTDWSTLKVTELRAELKRRGLVTTGLKAELVDRLEQNHQQEDGTITDEDDDDDDDDDEILDVEDIDIEELGRQARAAVEMFQTGEDGFDEEPTEEMLAELETEMAINGEFIDEPEPSVDLSKMTVAQLKDECRSRGLKVSGRKAELIERLENSTD